MALTIVIRLTEGNIRNHHIYLTKHVDFFPADSIGASSARKGMGTLLQLHVVGMKDAIETDIAGDKMIFRKRGWCRSFFESCNLGPEDSVIIERVSDYEYEVYPKLARQR